jgi:2-polyprenyl-3-methyl-5-hydroxy-6-metoxy-1,4-benzoquinol methylase
MVLSSWYGAVMPSNEAEEFWEQFYEQRSQVWSGRPNAVLVEEIDGMAPGTALDLGCGEGADAIWLAQHGWQVTAADISQAALDRAAEHAATAGVADRITWARHDFSRSIPVGPFDLVSAHFLHSPVDDPRDSALRAAAEAVGPDGTLLVVSHEAVPWHEHVVFPTAQEVLESLAIDPVAWTIERLGSRPRRAKTPDGVEVDVDDSVVRLRRL